jgi:hypothetical protein
MGQSEPDKKHDLSDLLRKPVPELGQIDSPIDPSVLDRNWPAPEKVWVFSN